MTNRSRHSYSETITALTTAIAGASNTIFATIDQSAAVEGVGLAYRCRLFFTPRDYASTGRKSPANCSRAN